MGPIDNPCENISGPYLTLTINKKRNIKTSLRVRLYAFCAIYLFYYLYFVGKGVLTSKFFVILLASMSICFCLVETSKENAKLVEMENIRMHETFFVNTLMCSLY